MSARFQLPQNTLCIWTLIFSQVEGAFSQPNGGMCEKMLTWAKKVTRGSSEHDMLELYCGNGNFTIALAPNFR